MSFDPNRMHRFFLRWLISTACIVSALLFICGGSARAKDDLMIEDLAVSPDGRIVAFQFSPAPDGLHGLGLYDWRAGTLTRIPNPDGKQLGVPRFSYDGKRLAVVISDRNEKIKTDIATVDLSTMEVTQITHDHPEILGGRTSPVFQPETDNILYVYGGIGIYSQLRLINIKTGDERVILDKNNGFSVSILPPYFVGTDEIYFQAIAPVNEAVRKEVDSLGASSVTAIIAYRLRFGEQPTILFPEIERQRNIFNGHVHRDLNFLTASENGRDVYFIDFVGKDANSKYGNYDIFKIVKNNETKRVTHTNSYISLTRVSADGTTIVFGSDPERRGRVDLYIFDVVTGGVTETNLLEKTHTDVRFSFNG